ncbi:MAG TPA: hypothetical protein VFT43_02365 [Candidatus Polarisedimenticolia bacterium]|nr:hypothetical protein [Candidatus Polarisedimenticolia bacterium]
MTRARAAWLLAGVFLLGVVCGAFGFATFGLHHLRHRFDNPERMEEMVVRHISRRLHLDDEQRKVLEEVTRKAHVELRQVRDDTLPRLEAIVNQACDELRPRLRPDQQDGLETIRKEALERLRRHRPPA